MSCSRSLASWLKLLLMTSMLGMLLACADDDYEPPPPPPTGDVVEIAASPNFENDLKTALINAEPGQTIVLPEGTFEMSSGMILDVSNVTVQGKGQDKTVLDFSQSTAGGDGFLVNSNNVVLEHFAVVDTPGDGIKFKFSNGVTVRNMRVEWSCGPCEENGAYGIYPVQTKNVLIEDSIAIGASDAGIYVGQSDNIIVRRNLAAFNVAGIEIENSTNSDVYENVAENNTGGILAFDLPGLPRAGMRSRIFNNNVRNNNVANFAPAGNIVATVPQGTGMLIMAFEDVEVFGNVIENNQSSAILVVNYAISGLNHNDPNYDPDPRRMNIHDNEYRNNAYDPADAAAGIASEFDAVGGLPQVFYDGIAESGGAFAGPDRICVREASSVTRGVLFHPDGSGASNDPAFFDCAHASLPQVVLDTPEDIEAGEKPPTDAEIAEMCTPEAGSETPNLKAVEVNCPTLSGYNLFADQTEPREATNAGIHYDLITPLFTDYASKYRFIFVPEGKQAAYSDREVMDMPIGTIVSKTFTMPRDFLNPASGEVIIETRILIRREQGWAALPYIWREDGSDADLSITGGTRQLNWIHADGSTRSTNYEIPDTNQCKTCHSISRPETGSGRNFETALEMIGPKARFLNRDNEYGGQTVNQLTYMKEQGVLVGLPDDLDSIDTVPVWTDTAASLEDRAKGYLDINCAHCHRPAGFASNSALFLDYWRAVDETFGICKTPVAAGAGSGGLQYDIVPGNAAESIFDYRMDSNEPDVRMPEIGRTLIHTEGVALVREWINSLAGGCP